MPRIPHHIQLELFKSRPSMQWRDEEPPERGLMIRDPYVTDILLGKKTWELRGAATKVRGRIGLIKSKSGHVFGEAEIIDVRGPLSLRDLLMSWQIGPHDREELKQAERVPYLDKDGSSRTFAWILGSVVTYQPPVPYRHPSGAITFVDLRNALGV